MFSENCLSVSEGLVAFCWLTFFVSSFYIFENKAQLVETLPQNFEGILRNLSFLNIFRNVYLTPFTLFSVKTKYRSLVIQFLLPGNISTVTCDAWACEEVQSTLLSLLRLSHQDFCPKATNRTLCHICTLETITFHCVPSHLI